MLAVMALLVLLTGCGQTADSEPPEPENVPDVPAQEEPAPPEPVPNAPLRKTAGMMWM